MRTEAGKSSLADAGALPADAKIAVMGGIPKPVRASDASTGPTTWFVVFNTIGPGLAKASVHTPADRPTRPLIAADSGRSGRFTHDSGDLAPP